MNDRHGEQRGRGPEYEVNLTLALQSCTHFCDDSTILENKTTLFGSSVDITPLILFFSSSLELRGLRDPQQVECYQDQAQIMLGDYIRRHFPGQQVRFGKLLLMLPSLRMVNPKTIEELFFRQTIGSVAIESLLCDMFKSS